MKTQRYIDAQGRIVLPAHIREALDLSGGKLVELNLEEDGTIRVRPATERCALCGESVEGRSHLTVHGKNVCALCAYDVENGEWT